MKENGWHLEGYIDGEWKTLLGPNCLDGMRDAESYLIFGDWEPETRISLYVDGILHKRGVVIQQPPFRITYDHTM